MGMVVVAATRDRTRVGWARLGQVLLKDLLRVMAPLVLVRNSLLRPGPSWDIGRIKIIWVHASLTSKKQLS
ncbi:hypothetical protein CVM73_19085 [Bradyrhizobium forestalis]|uniref:Uncharacterized protein n=1 Tax=Bradyrhizobium forestalis TaxID=1419263 RepID=A0A2M8R717_9BRAD|nr:hypothetical protein CVM73_19085 [Bradyrhizobium forestalis]